MRHHQPKIPLSIIILFVVLSLAACAQNPRLLGNPQAPYPLASPPEIGQIVHLPTGILVSKEQMLDIAGDNRIVYVGETHDNPASHRLELAVLKSMAARHPGKVALGMEMFTPAQDAVLTDWVEGKLTEKAFLKKSEWYKVWKDDFDYYRDILNYARENRIPVIGLNAEKSTVHLLVTNDVSQLPENERAKLPEMDLSDPYQLGLVEGIYGGHVKSSGMLEGFHRAQTLWDETMAQSIADFLDREDHRDFRMVVFAGGNHVRFGFGIPRRVFRRLPLSYTLIGGKEIEIPESKKDRLMDVTLPEFPMPPYDFLVFLKYEELDKDDVKLGVMLNDEEGQVVVEMVAPGSNAERAGILAGDIIQSIDGEMMIDNFDVVYALSNKLAGDKITVQISRGDEDLTYEMLLKKNENHSVHQGPK